MTMDYWLKIIGGIGVVLTAIAAIAAALVKRFPPRATGLAADLAVVKKDLADQAAQHSTEMDAMRTRLATVEQQVRVLTDYSHDLRADYARDTGNPPRDWPKDLKQ